ncbi:tetratricopeptide repeat protein [Bradyrhizobium sp. ISRA463]|uniref:tetratricopeptide repeat protein n=1 Tax=Bradyrhizobium sp. ISRA463 TaxID=2866199 RepID=UPI0032B039B8
MAEFDSRGLPISTGSPQAARSYRTGVDLLLSAWPGAEDALRQAIDHDPQFALAHAALARLYAIKGQPADARASIATAQAIVARNGSPREIGHVSVVALAVTGQSVKALETTLAHLDQWPRDVLILSLPLGAFGLFAFSGMTDHDQARVDLCETLADRYDADDWWFLTYRGWSHAENGSVAKGRDFAQRGLEQRRANANAAHAVAHAMFEQGATREAETLLEGWLPEYDRAGLLHGHLAWHAALSALERDDPQHVLAIYSKHVRPSVSLGLPINVVSDTVSLLWRLQAYGYDVPPACGRRPRATRDRDIRTLASLSSKSTWDSWRRRPDDTWLRPTVSTQTLSASRTAHCRPAPSSRRSVRPRSLLRTPITLNACESSSPWLEKSLASAAAARRGKSSRTCCCSL